MEQSINIIMQCPKCLKEFPLDVNYCEACSVMLEPIEVEQKTLEAIKKKKKKAFNEDLRGERIEDVKLDSLKADIEGNFVSTLLHELSQLRKRLKRKEKLLAVLDKKKKRMEHSDYLYEVEKKKNEIKEINQKTERLKAILYNLGKKIEADISDIISKLKYVSNPGFFWFLSANGRYHKMLVSAQKKKSELLDVLLLKKSHHYFIWKRFKKIFLLFIVSVICSLAVSWYLLSNYYWKEKPAGNVIQQTTQGELITKNDINTLLEDIKNANLTKDIALWETRYTKAYLGTDRKKEKQFEQWEKFDFKSLDYAVHDIEIKAGTASALVMWEMEVLSKDRKTAMILPQKLLVGFMMEDGRLKINSVQKYEK